MVPEREAEMTHTDMNRVKRTTSRRSSIAAAIVMTVVLVGVGPAGAAKPNAGPKVTPTTARQAARPQPKPARTPCLDRPTSEVPPRGGWLSPAGDWVDRLPTGDVESRSRAVQAVEERMLAYLPTDWYVAPRDAREVRRSGCITHLWVIARRLGHESVGGWVSVAVQRLSGPIRPSTLQGDGVRRTLAAGAILGSQSGFDASEGVSLIRADGTLVEISPFGRPLTGARVESLAIDVAATIPGKNPPVPTRPVSRPSGNAPTVSTTSPDNRPPTVPTTGTSTTTTQPATTTSTTTVVTTPQAELGRTGTVLRGSRTTTGAQTATSTCETANVTASSVRAAQVNAGGGGQNVRFEGGRWTVTGGVSTLVAKVTSPKRTVTLRWWLLHMPNPPADEHLVIDGCTATLYATRSLGTAYQASAYVLAAEDGDRAPAFDSFNGAKRVLIYDPSNAPSGEPRNCTGSVVINIGRPVFRVTFQGVGTWDAEGLTVPQLNGVPEGTYTVTIDGGTWERVPVVCNTRNYILVR